jgi:hypothetical protein
MTDKIAVKRRSGNVFVFAAIVGLEQVEASR